MPDSNSQRDNTRAGYARFLTLGFTFVSIIGGLTLIGFLADRLLGTLPLFLLVGLVVGFVGGLVYVYRALGGLGR